MPSSLSLSTAPVPKPAPEKPKEVPEPVAAPVVPTEAQEPPAAAAPVAAMPVPKTILEALEQRLAKYQTTQQQAQEEGNSSKARRLGRIVKQYQDAIKLHKAGKPIPFDELPDPPGKLCKLLLGLTHVHVLFTGFPPIPGAPRKAEEPEGGEAGAPTAQPQDQPAAAAPTKSAAATVSPPSGGQAPPKPPPKKTALATRQDKQLAQLMERQTMFKAAALEAKKSGDLDLAKEYLRMAKGIDPLISANKCGIPVDMDTVSHCNELVPIV